MISYVNQAQSFEKTEKRKAYRKKWKEENRTRINAKARMRYTTDGRWEKQIWDRFKMLPEMYWKMHEDQGGVCKICGKTQMVGTKLDVDHNHTTGQVRGLLCRHCNTGIGLLKDDPTLILKALDYLLDNSERSRYTSPNSTSTSSTRR